MFNVNRWIVVHPLHTHHARLLTQTSSSESMSPTAFRHARAAFFHVIHRTRQSSSRRPTCFRECQLLLRLRPAKNSLSMAAATYSSFQSIVAIAAEGCCLLAHPTLARVRNRGAGGLLSLVSPPSSLTLARELSRVVHGCRLFHKLLSLSTSVSFSLPKTTTLGLGLSLSLTLCVSSFFFPLIFSLFFFSSWFLTQQNCCIPLAVFRPRMAYCFLEFYSHSKPIK